MTEEDLKAIIDGIAPVLRAEFAMRQARLDEVQTRCQAVEQRTAALEQQLTDLRVEVDALLQVRS